MSACPYELQYFNNNSLTLVFSCSINMAKWHLKSNDVTNKRLAYQHNKNNITFLYFIIGI